MALSREAVIRMLRMPRKRLCHSTDSVVATDIDRVTLMNVTVIMDLSAWFSDLELPRLPFVPNAHQQVLQDRQLILIVDDVVKHLVKETRGNLAVAQSNWTGNHVAQLV